MMMNLQASCKQSFFFIFKVGRTIKHELISISNAEDQKVRSKGAIITSAHSSYIFMNNSSGVREPSIHNVSLIPQRLTLYDQTILSYSDLCHVEAVPKGE